MPNFPQSPFLVDYHDIDSVSESKSLPHDAGMPKCLTVDISSFAKLLTVVHCDLDYLIIVSRCASCSFDCSSVRSLARSFNEMLTLAFSQRRVGRGGSHRSVGIANSRRHLFISHFR